MKTPILAILLFAVIPAIAQKKTDEQILMDRMNEYGIPNRDGYPFYEFIDSIPGKSKADIHRAARAALAKSFGDSKDVLRVDDIEAGSIVGKGITKFYWKTIGMPVAVAIPFVVEITSKDGKYRIQLKDIKSLKNGDFGEGAETTLIRIAKAGDSYNKKAWPNIDRELNAALATIAGKIRDEFKSANDF
jgi:hypothetical protein